MIKLLIFDMDNTLIDLSDAHIRALNGALLEVDHKYIISDEEHYTTYNALTTKTKLLKLTEKKGLPEEFYEQIWTKKQELTFHEIEKLEKDQQVYNTLEKLKNDNLLIRMCVASNSINRTVRDALIKTELIGFVDLFLGNEDVWFPKPNPEVFITAMKRFNVLPSETLIFEDSTYGLQAAYASGAHVYKVNSPKDIKYNEIKFHIDYLNASAGFYR
jgi:HAD superfamily hydrolase (TIGR01509 family)